MGKMVINLDFNFDINNESFIAYREEFQKYTIITKKSHLHGNNSPFCITSVKDKECYEMIIDNVTDLGDSIKYTLSVQGFLDLGQEYIITDNSGLSVDLKLGYISRTREFDKRYRYRHHDLGATVNGETTMFKVWTPTATDVSVIIFEGADEIPYHMTRDNIGVWQTTVNMDLTGCKYLYQVTNNGITNEVIDPYAKASTANHTFSVVVDLNNFDKAHTNYTKSSPKITDAIIYEISIRDFTSHPSANTKARKSSYTAFTEKLDYLKRLGVTHLQIMPFYDCQTVDDNNPEDNYNWGYDPIQFQVPEGSFSEHPTDPESRLKELVNMINCIHDAGMYVVMDSVYNHVYQRGEHPFDALVPTYYFRYDHVGMATNGSGCGNDVASERYMVRKYITDSIRYWVEYFAIDGFRFDLMGLLDVDTMVKIRQVCDELNPNIILYGEGWNMQTALCDVNKANAENMSRLPGVSFFNDRFRDTIKGNSFMMYDRGLALGHKVHDNNVRFLLTGSCGLVHGQTNMFYSPGQSINYVSCHDNHTLWDKISIALHHKTDEEKRRVHMLAIAMTIFSQGVPFLHSGCEIFRSKGGIENSYNSPDSVNWFNWDDVETYSDYIDLVAHWIELRKSHGAFRFINSLDVKEHASIHYHYDSIIEYRLTNVGTYGKWETIQVFYNVKNQKYTLPTLRDDSYVCNIGSFDNVDIIDIDGLSTTIVVSG